MDIVSCQTNLTALCNPSANDWHQRHAKDKFSCITSCQGVYSDVNYNKTENTGNLFKEVARKYSRLKKDFTENFQYSRTSEEANVLNEHGRLM